MVTQLVAYLDTETTGLLAPVEAGIDAQPYVIDVGAVVARVPEFAIVQEVNQLIRPPVPLEPRITKITGLDDKALEGAPTFLEYAPTLLKVLSGVDLIVCHNAAFDMGVLGYELARCGLGAATLPPSLCTVEEFMPMFGRRAKLTEVWELVFSTTLDEQHRALSDARDLFTICREVGIPCTRLA